MRTLERFVAKVIGTRVEITEILRAQGPPMHVLALPLLTESGSVLQGVLVVLYDVSYIDEGASGRLIHSAFWIALITLLVVTLVTAVTHLRAASA